MATRKSPPVSGGDRDLPPRRGPKAARGQIAERILAAARTSFATRGYAGTTLRDVAGTAGVDRALVTYYFDSKAGLLAAAIQPPEGFIEDAMRASSAPLRARGRALTENMLTQWETPGLAEVLRSIILTAAHEPAAMQRLRGVLTGSLLAAVAGHLDDDERTLRAGLAASQLIGVAMARYVWRVGALAELDRDQVVRYVAPTIQHYLTGRLPARPQPPAVPAARTEATVHPPHP
jgi:AcrR family transcriptional regulator